MTERELSRLKRPELIERLIKQDRVNSKLKTKIERMERRSAEHLDQIDELKRTLERLKKKLDAKDAEMESTFNRLKKKLDAKDAEMENSIYVTASEFITSTWIFLRRYTGRFVERSLP
jgi:uncharacterized coiled-coil protein SlyX